MAGLGHLVLSPLQTGGLAVRVREPFITGKPEARSEKKSFVPSWEAQKAEI